MFLGLRKNEEVLHFSDLETEAKWAVFSPQKQKLGGDFRWVSGREAWGGRALETRWAGCVGVWSHSSLKLGRLACTRLNSISELVSGKKVAFFQLFIQGLYNDWNNY